MAQIIMIEGIDRVGKTTLIKLLEKKYDFVSFKDKSYFDFNAHSYITNVEKVVTFLEMVKQLNLTIVCDRCFLSEVVYSFVERKRDDAFIFYDTMCKYIKDMIKNDGLKVLLVYVKPVDIYYSALLHGKLQEKHDKMYERIYKAIEFDKKECNYNNLNEIAAEIKGWSEIRE